MHEYISKYKRLPIKAREKYIRIARLRYYAEINNLRIHKLSKEDSYHIYNDSGYHKVCTLDEAENLFKILKKRYFEKLGENQNDNKSES